MWDVFSICGTPAHPVHRCLSVCSLYCLQPVIAAAAVYFAATNKKGPRTPHQYELLVNFHPKNEVIKKRERERERGNMSVL